MHLIGNTCYLIIKTSSGGVYAMPPKTQFSAEKIIDAAICITRRDGFAAVTARNIGKELSCSVKPIFTAFENMDGVMAATIKAANGIFIEYMQSPYKKLSFMQIGLRWIQFSRDEPRLYQLLFMPVSRGTRIFTPLNLSMNFGELTDKIIPIICREFALDEGCALKLYNQMILHAHGIACLIAAGETDFTEQSIREIFSETVEGLVMYYKAGGRRENCE